MKQRRPRRLATAVAVMVALQGCAPESDARLQARELHGRATQAWANGDLRTAATLLSEAWNVDSTFAYALLDLPGVSALQETSGWAITIARSAGERAPHAQCARAAVAYLLGYIESSALLDRSAGAGPCELAAVLDFTLWPPGSEYDRLVMAKRLVRLAPDVVYPYALLASAAAATGDVDAMLDASVWVDDPQVPMRARIEGANLREAALRAKGNVRAAERTHASAAEAARRLGPVMHASYELRRAGIARTPLHPRPSRRAETARADMLREALAAAELHTRGVLPAAAWLVGIERAEADLAAGDLTLSIARLDSLVRLADTHLGNAQRAHARARRGRAYVKNGMLEAAEADLRAAASLAAEDGSPQWRTESAHNLLHLYESQNREREADSAAREFIRLTTSAVPYPLGMMSKRDYAIFLRRTGRHAEAHWHFARMVEDIDVIGAGMAHYAGEYFEETGDLARARIYFEQSLVPGTEGYLRTLASLTRLAIEAGDLAKASAYAARHDSARSVNYPEHRPLLPAVSVANGELEEADTLYAHARRDAETRGQATAWAALAVEHAELLLRRRQFARARVIADSATRRLRGSEPELAARATGIAGVAEVAIKPATYTAATSALRASITESTQRQQPRLEQELRSLHGQALAYAGMCESALTEYAHAQSLLDSLAASETEQTARFSRLGSDDRPARRALGVLATCGDGAPHVHRFARASHARKARVGPSGTLPPQVASGFAPFARASAPDVATVDFTLLEDEAYALIATRNRDTVVRLPASPDSLTLLVRRLRSGTAAVVGTSLDLTRTHYDTAAAHALYNATLGALAPLIAHARHITIVPDGALALVPFDGLVISTGPAPEFVIDRFVVSLAPSLGDAWAASHTIAAGRAGRVLVVAPDSSVPGIGDELRRVQQAWPAGRVHTLLAEHATPRAVVDAVRGAAVVHFASHAASNEAHPATSYLALAPSPGADGRLLADASASLALGGAVVVLSACSTGAGRVAGRAGALSLSRAFLDGGAQAVVATLWAVGEGSAVIVGALHQALARGTPVAVALREAKLATRRAGQSPIAWAGWTLTARGGRAPVTFSAAARQ